MVLLGVWYQALPFAFCHYHRSPFQCRGYLKTTPSLELLLFAQQSSPTPGKKDSLTDKEEGNRHSTLSPDPSQAPPCQVQLLTPLSPPSLRWDRCEDARVATGAPHNPPPCSPSTMAHCLWVQQIPLDPCAQKPVVQAEGAAPTP